MRSHSVKSSWLLWMQSMMVVMVLCMASQKFMCAHGFNFGFQTRSSGSSSSTSALQPGDTIAVIGASGNVGKLVALRLSDTFKIKGIVRDASSVESFFQDRSNIELLECDLLSEMRGTTSSTSSNALEKALEGAHCVVICTGTTAFPTQAWSRSGESSVTGDVLQALLDCSFEVKTAIESLDAKGLNTPNNIDDKANDFVLDVWEKVCQVRLKRAIMLSSIGVQRRDSMPFPILNACGVLSAKAKGESSLQARAKANDYSYTIVRPGQLFGGPYDNNYYLGTLFQLDKDVNTQDVSVGRGDELLGDTLRSTLAEVTAQICEQDCARDLDFAVVNVAGDAPSVEALQEKLIAL